MKESDIRNQIILDEYIELVEKDTKKLFDLNKFIQISCPACGCLEVKEEFVKSGFTYVSCPKCGTLYANPRPTEKQLDYFYSKSESNKFWAEKFFMPFAEARRQKIFKPRAHEIIEQFSDISEGKIGDIGAGFGIFLEELSKLWKEAKLVAIEPQEDMIKICKEKGLTVIPKMFEDVMIDEGGFDLLCAFELFEHLNNPKY